MGRSHQPRSGSLQYYHRRRSKRIYPRIRAWAQNASKEPRILGFAGYKVGMTHIAYKDTNPNSPTKNENIFCPVTVLECPPLRLLSIKFYGNTYGRKVLIGQEFAPKLEKELKRKIIPPKKTKQENTDSILSKATEIRLEVYTQPRLTGVGKKKPEIFELALTNLNPKTQYDYAKSLFDKEIRVQEIFKEGQFIDIHAVTKGKGLQGAVKRFGVSLKSHKSEKKRRSAGNLGAWTPKKVSFRVPQKGQMGFHTRTEYNKALILINSDPKIINPKDGFSHYGYIKNDFVLIKGSVAGARKRLIRLNEPIRSKEPQRNFDVTHISVESKQ